MAITIDTKPPPAPSTLREKIAALEVGQSLWTDEHALRVVRVTASRAKSGGGGKSWRFKTALRTMSGVRVWAVGVMDAYADFLARKAILDPDTGLAEPGALIEALFPFQADLTRWALRRGRAALFAGTGLGKSLMELAWADAIHRETGGDILHLTPLAVGAQMVREAEKFEVSGVRHVHAQIDCDGGTNITNYQKLEHFNLSRFGAVILDESSILKSYDGHYRSRLIEECARIPFRLAATATPAPNDFMELGNHAEFLGVMSYTDMLATFFVHDGGDTRAWRLKGHAENDFWRWLASWAVMLRKPSDLGYTDDGYDLPPLNRA